MSKLIAAAVFAVVAFSDPHQTSSKFRVGGIDFCVPAASNAELDVWWIPKQLPSEGFVFQLQPNELPGMIPTRDIRGNPTPVIGFIANGTGLAPNSHVLARRTKSPESVIERDSNSDYVLAYESARREHWTVWRLPADAALTTESLEQRGEPLATCRRPAGAALAQWKGSTATCQRNMWSNGLHVGFSFDFANLSRIDQVDKQVLGSISGWKCTLRAE